MSFINFNRRIFSSFSVMHSTTRCAFSPCNKNTTLRPKVCIRQMAMSSKMSTAGEDWNLNWPKFIKRWAFKKSGFNQYGLYHDDVLWEYDDVKEALKRLPPQLLDERNFRLQRAIQCSIQKTVLPQDQWPTFEEDREKGRYLQPYLEQVRKEMKEYEEWENK